MMKPRAGKSLVKMAVIALALLPNLILAQQESDERAYFSTLVYNHSIYAVGGTITQFSILDYTNGIDTNTLKWQFLPIKTSPYEHGVAFKDANGDFLLQAGGNSTEIMEEMVKCTHKTLSCTSALLLKNSPPVTALMTATVNPNTNLVYYYGGVMVNTKTHEYRMTTNASSTFTSLDTTKTPMTWQTLNPSYPNAHRPSRAGHSSNIINDQIFIMGGVTFGANTSEPSDVILTDFNSVLVYDIVSNTAATITTFGDIPPHRLGYSTVNGPDNRSIVMFGGYIAGENQTHTAVDADIYVLDTCTLAWSKKSIKGSAPPGMFGHGAVNINNYMVVIMGKKDDNNYNRLVYILDMNSWKWVTSVDAKSLMETKTTTISECKFNLPNVTDTKFVQFNYDLSVLQNPLAPTKDDDKSKREGFGIGFGLFALILIGLGLYYYYRRISRKKASFLNPRWMRTMSSSRKGDGRDYPLFVYNKELDSNNPNNPYRPTPAAAFASHNVKTYTASDHEQWEQQINSDVHNDKNSISQDIWKRMRSLSNDEETGTQTSHPQTRKILDA